MTKALTHSTIAWISRPRRWLVMACMMTIMAGSSMAGPARSGGESAVMVAALRYGQGQTTTCFSAGFLHMVARHTSIELVRQLAVVDLASERLFDFPFVVMGADQPFALSPAEIRNLRAYLDRGGFLLASAACSDPRWGASFLSAMAQVYPDQAVEPLDVSHPAFQTLYEIRAFQGTHRPVEQAMYGLTVGGRLALIFSPVGLHDTDYAQGDARPAGDDSVADANDPAATGDARCCCCGGNELRDAHRINANILAYVLTR